MASVCTDFVSRSSSVDVREIDKQAKNPWRWKCLEKQAEGIYLREIIRKLNKCSACYCIVCSKELAYGSRGFVALTDHIESSFLQTRKEHFALPGSGYKKENDETLHGLPPTYAAFGPVAQENLSLPLTSLSNRTLNFEAMLLGLLAEKSLLFAMGT
ncbi:hypothetical protein AVEN_267387-1 [Araneus ventricosus]|uniref:Uncharacterized protein n=1 Tax=Araneus ventricosus TaxID=182803 RepID=A0A4Y2SKF1_ARAVE|nr:hypothetical protein AVEN_267387-1 [Araneus ventricosus]